MRRQRFAIDVEGSSRPKDHKRQLLDSVNGRALADIAMAAGGGGGAGGGRGVGGGGGGGGAAQ